MLYLASNLTTVCFIRRRVSAHMFHRHRDFYSRREFAAFIRALRLLVQASSDVHAYDVEQILAVISIELRPVDDERYHVLFGLYFRFDVSAQRPFFYREVKQFVRGLCVTRVSLWAS